MKSKFVSRVQDSMRNLVADLTQPLFDACEEALAEAAAATMRYRPFASPHEGYAVLKEEVDEMWDAIKNNDRRAARAEAVQVAAVALRYLAEFPEPGADVG